ncbi:phosphate ABC transporter substrate-binding protein PstS [Bdellovibrionota bacterium FG-1]
MKLTQTVILAVLLCASASTRGFAASQINGAGATFPYPLYSKWFSEYQKVAPEVQINYQSIGSGGGIRQFSEKTIDFGASDAPMTNEQLGKASAPILHIPTVLGAVVVTYNLPEAGEQLKLTPEVLADIFLGKVAQWNDPKIAASNPGVKLPATPIFVTHRSDGSGTTFIFSDYLSKVSPEWKQKPGAGTALNWPVGLGGKGNEGVTGLVKQTPGAIGYVEMIFAQENKLPMASLKNKAGQFVRPSPKSVTAAADASLKSIPEDFRVSITQAEGKDSYPLSGFTYLLVWKDMKASPEKGKSLIKFLKWAMREGQKMAEPLAYAPLPKSVIKKVEAKIESIQTQ